MPEQHTTPPRLGSNILLRTWRRYRRDNADLLGAGLAFYGLMSAAPLAWLSIRVASWALERNTARAALLESLRVAAGAGVAAQAERLLDALRGVVGGTSTWLAVALLTWAASRFFVQLQAVLNVIWEAPAQSSSPLGTLKTLTAKRALSFVMVLACGGVLLAGVLVHGVLARFSSHLTPIATALHISVPALVTQDVLLSIVLLTLLLASIYRVLPDVRIAWHDIWVGAAATAISIAAGTAALTWYLSREAQSITYGALGSIAALALWVYYLCQVLVLGATFTRACAERDSERHGAATTQTQAEVDGRAPRSRARWSARRRHSTARGALPGDHTSGNAG